MSGGIGWDDGGIGMVYATWFEMCVRVSSVFFIFFFGCMLGANDVPSM